MTADEPRQDDDDDGQTPLTFRQLVGSALAAAFGVQSSKNRQRDFSKGKPGQFIAVGVALTALFVVTMIVVVNLVLSALTR